MESERAEGREERGENGPLDDRRRRRIHCRNGGSQIAEILISNIFFVWKSVAGAFLSCVRRAARPLAQLGCGGQSHLRLEGRREVGAAKMFRTLSRKIPWVMGPPLVSRLKGARGHGRVVATRWSDKRCRDDIGHKRIRILSTAADHSTAPVET